MIAINRHPASTNEAPECRIPESEKEKEQLQFFLARFKPETYTLIRRQDKMVEIRPVLPEEIEQKRQASQAESEFRMLAQFTALRARRILNSGKSLAEDELPEFFHQLQRIQHPEFPDLSQSEIAADASLRVAFLHILTELCSRSIAEAVHLRDRVSHIIATV